MSQPLASQSFSNDASLATMTLAGPAYNVTGGPTSLAFSYDATSGTYLVTANSTSQSFSSSNLDATLSNSQINVFKVTTGSTTDTLTLTRPGTSGTLTYTYVGAGFWQRTTTAGSAPAGQLAAFAYGYPTLIGGIPKTGSVSYPVYGLGAAGYPGGNLNSLSGSGAITFYFATGEVRLGAMVTEVDSTSLITLNTWQVKGSGMLSSSSNGFSGSMSVTGLLLDGQFSGRLYGPNTEEVGLTFYANGQGITFEGALLGRRDSGLGITVNPAASYIFNSPPSLGYTISSSGLVDNAFSYHATSLSVLGANSYQIADGGSKYLTFAPSDKISSDATWSVSQLLSGATTEELKMFNAGAANPTLALTYSSFGFWKSATSQTGGSTLVVDRPFVYGQLTSDALMPKLGSATYTGYVYGRGVGPSTTNEQYELTGTVRFDANFASGGLSSTIDGNLRNTTTNLTGAFPTLTMQGSISPINMAGSWLNGTNSAGWNGTMYSFFYGPAAQEIGGTFTVTKPSTSSPTTIVGVAVATRP
ncbi:hypothetical protein FHW96_003525 [Novosphingobium sp. SG751A]|uniref:transferrin-binding protein-like solute binding protein n=1 Tax=Novosphingobium sp. SG751A TaxID=2587000 RepID=UPI00155815F3|nr:transferrin-binding protein-like solute binding protein [Novosphingobium sp. SG751A]NOW47347.1 hypothetical protein [Novosphingobium sp. SG751A]